MMVRRTLQWIATILALGGASGGGYAYWLYSQSNEWLRTEVQKWALKRVPNARVEIGGARFDWSHRIHLYNVRLSAKGLNEPIARCVEIVITLDGQELSEDQKIDARSIRVVRPDVRLLRDSQGNWNWQNLLPLQTPEDPCPEILFDDLQVGLRIARSSGEPLALHVPQSNVRLVPSAHRQFAVEGTGRLPGAGDVHFEGGWDLDKRSWRVRCGTNGAANVSDVLEIVEQTYPEARRRIADALNRHLGGGPVTTADLSESRPPTEPAITGQAAINFEIARPAGKPDLAYWLRVSLGQGGVDHPTLPFSLNGLSGTIYVDNRQLVLKEVTGHNGTTQITVDGRLDLPAPRPGNRIAVAVDDLALDGRLQSCLWPTARRFYDLVRPAGQIDAAGLVVRTDQDKWDFADWTVRFKNCSASHKDFPYPVTQIVGTAKQEGVGKIFKINLRGRAGIRTATLTGRVVDPGPEAEADYAVTLERLPIDSTLLTAAAARPPLRKTLDNLRLRGLLDVSCRFHRAPGPNQKIAWWLDVGMANGSIEFVGFPYRIDDLSGHVAFNSTTETWKFNDLHGSHGPAQISGEGTFVKHSPRDPGRLTLDLRAEDVPLEKDLQLAFPPASQRIWDLIEPAGKLKMRVALGWIPGKKPAIAIPEAVVTDGSLEVKPFPFSLEHITASFQYGYDDEYKQDRISILSFDGHHDETRIRTYDFGHSFVLCPSDEDPSGEWRVRFVRLIIDDLIPDRTLRRALPAGLRKTVKALDPEGTVTLDGMVELRGTRDPADPVTAAWNFKSILSGASIVAGAKLDKVYGIAATRGVWDGQKVRMQGRVDLNSVVVWKHQFTNVRGPFDLANQELTVGSPKAFIPLPAGAPQQPIANEERMTATAAGGVFLLDAKAHLNAEKTDYHVKAEMHNASLDKYAKDYNLPGARSLHGVMNGWVDLAGNTPDPKDVVGSGQLLINPAALYELPVFVQIFKAFNLAQPDKTAFRYALASFNVGNRKVGFSRIDLMGDVISLRGRGQASFDGPLHLEFYSRGAGAWRQVPIVNAVFDQLTQGWWGVSVMGTVQNPIAHAKAVPQLDDAMRRFLGAFNPAPGSVPQLAPPPWMLMSTPRSATAIQ